MKHGISEASYKILLKNLHRFADVEEAVLFGSRAKGTSKNASDIDVAIKGTNASEKTALELAAHLNEGTPSPYHFDIVCYNTITHAELKDHIDRVGVSIFKRSSSASMP